MEVSKALFLKNIKKFSERIIYNILTPPHYEEEYHQLIVILDEVIDIAEEDESHPLSSLMETFRTLVDSYEARNIPEIGGSSIHALKLLMEEHNLKQSDLPEIGSQGMVSKERS